MRFKSIISCYVSLFLTLLLMTNTVVCEAAASTPPPKLRIVIVEGQGATNNIRQRTAREPVVEVVDENNRPVSGASVTFLLPDKGAGGVFADGGTHLQVLTDELGRAAARGLVPNSVSGAFRISIEVSYLGETATASIIQSNAAGATFGLSGKLLTLLAVGGGVAAGAAVVLGRGDHKPSILTPLPTDTFVVPGRPAVGGPQ